MVQVFPLRQAQALDFNSPNGRLPIFVGYFLFVGFVSAGAYLIFKGWLQYKSGQSSMNPLSCIPAVTFLILMIAAGLMLAGRFWR